MLGFIYKRRPDPTPSPAAKAKLVTNHCTWTYVRSHFYQDQQYYSWTRLGKDKRARVKSCSFKHASSALCFQHRGRCPIKDPGQNKGQYFQILFQSCPKNNLAINNQPLPKDLLGWSPCLQRVVMFEYSFHIFTDLRMCLLHLNHKPATIIKGMHCCTVSAPYRTRWHTAQSRKNYVQSFIFSFYLECHLFLRIFILSVLLIISVL